MFYEIFRILGLIAAYPLKCIYFKDKIYYENENVTKRVDGGALIISNHFHVYDYMLNLFVFFPRKLYVVAASEYAFKNAFLRFGMKFWGGIEVKRASKNMFFVSESVREIKNGNLVQIFPEGRITDDGKIKDFYPSYVLIALRANAPIIPLISDGNYGLFKRAHLIMGEPIDINDYISSSDATKADIKRANTIIREKVVRLREELDLRIEADKRKGKRK